MTREEAIKHARKIIRFGLDDKTNDFLDLAINALEQEPCEDAISRQAVLDIIDSDWKYEGMEQYINELPPVNPQPKTGHWITTRTFMHDGEFYCDKCKCESPNNEKWDYCPSCGAKMVEPQERREKE